MSQKNVIAIRKASSSTRNQYLAAFAVNIITLSHGIAIVWLSPFLPYLRSNDSHLTSGPVNSEDVSWIGSSLCIGGFLGSIISGKISEKFGKKNTLLLLVIPHFVFWILVLASTHNYHLYLARFSAGLTGGGVLRIVSLFMAEISENRIRGRLGSYLMLFLSAGMLIVFVAGTYLSFFTVPLLVMILPTAFFISVLFLYDTPQSLMARNKPEEALKSLRFYRTCKKGELADENLKDEYDLLKKTLESKEYEKPNISDFLEPTASKAMIIGLFLMFLNQFSGSLAVMTYTADIFKDSGSNFTPNESSMIVAFIQLVGVYFSSFLVDKFGRKILMVTSCIGSSVFFFVLAAYSYLKKLDDFDVSSYGWVPVLSLSLVIFIASLGIIALPFVITTELLPNKIRNTATTVCTSSVTVFAFIILKIFPPMISKYGLHFCMFFFSAVCLSGAVVTIVFIPETKGRSLIIAQNVDPAEVVGMLNVRDKK